jgi:uncharacterized protein YsxB (DUF464 family)
MIKVTVTRHHIEHTIKAFTISGHAGYANPGEDIVCAAVTAVSFGTVNAIEVLLQTELEVEMEEDGGFLHCVVPIQLEQDQTTHEKVQLLLESMIVSLQCIASDNGKYITISD